jgi:hypothetical protein
LGWSQALTFAIGRTIRFPARGLTPIPHENQLLYRPWDRWQGGFVRGSVQHPHRASCGTRIDHPQW